MSRRIRRNSHIVFANVQGSARFQHFRVVVERRNLERFGIALPPQPNFLQQDKHKTIRAKDNNEVGATNVEVETLFRLVGQRRQRVPVNRVDHAQRAVDARDGPEHDRRVHANGILPRVAAAAALQKNLRVEGDVCRLDDHEAGKNESADGAGQDEEKRQIRRRGADVVGQERLPERHAEDVGEDAVGDEVAARDGEADLDDGVGVDVACDVLGLHALFVELGREEKEEQHRHDDEGVD